MAELAGEIRNSLGVRLAPVEPGSFLMGAGEELASRDWRNAKPQRRVTISQRFAVAIEAVTLEQFRLFAPGFKGSHRFGPTATGVTWRQAAAFAAWLSDREGRSYRLPTEAEWEYVAKGSGEASEAVSRIRGRGVKVWCHDWYGPYPEVAETDPVGYASGQSKVVRGCGMGGIGPRRAAEEEQAAIEIDYDRPEARLAFPPAFGIPERSAEPSGEHSIGILLVLGPKPTGKPLQRAPMLHQIGVRRSSPLARVGPYPERPYFRKRVYLPIPPRGKYGSTPEDAADIDAVGLPAYLRPHNHSPALCAMPNGDLLMAAYSSYREYEAGVSIIASRLRHGAEDWDFPSLLVDQTGVNNHAPLLVRDGEAVHLFWGSPGPSGRRSGPEGFPFQWMTTRDSGATWGPVRFPSFAQRAGRHARQPINSAFRDGRGRLLVACDSEHSEGEAMEAQSSLLWATEDDGETWYDTGGRSYGLHTPFVETSDGRLIGFGARQVDIDGYMPLAISSDGGRSYEAVKSPFPALSYNQRPSALRLASGRLIFASDYVRKVDGKVRIPGKLGCYIAISEDDGDTWRFKQLPGAEPHQHPEAKERMGGEDGATLGYSCLVQAPNGLIHLIGTLTLPMAHFAFNEAWLLSGCETLEEAEMRRGECSTVVQEREMVEELWSSGGLRGSWGGGRSSETGSFVLDGPQAWSYQDGRPQWTATYDRGAKKGVERHYAPDGKPVWEWKREADGTAVWSQYWANGQIRSESRWRGMLAHGRARRWSRDGAPVSDVVFDRGVLAESCDEGGASED